MWILKNSKELLEHLKSPAFNHVTSIKSFDFSTLYTTIPHQKLKERLTSIIRNAFIFKNGYRRYRYLVLGHEEAYFVKEHSDSKNKYSEEDIIKMLEFLVDNIFVVFAGKVFQQTVGIPMGTNCAPLLADIFLYSYEADFIQSLLSTGKKHLASRFNLTYRNKTNQPISSNSHPSATEKYAIFSLKIGGGGVQNQQEHHIILTKYEAVHPTGASMMYCP